MSMTLNERIAKYDADPLMHYYVYFSISSYTFTVDVIKFKDIEEIKSEYYAKLKYYDTYAEAKAFADEMTAKDDNVNHLFCRELLSIGNKLADLKDAHYGKLTVLDTKAIDTLSSTIQLVQSIFDAKEEI